MKVSSPQMAWRVVQNENSKKICQKLGYAEKNHASLLPDVPWQMPAVMDTSSMAMSPVKSVPLIPSKVI